MTRLEHCNIRTRDLAATLRFYEDILGLKNGPFPGTPGRGAWLHDDDGTAVIHIVLVDPDPTEQDLDLIRMRVGALDGGSLTSGSGAVDHIAFRCDDYDRMIDRLRDHGLDYRSMDAPEIGLRLLFVNDPSGVTLELNFRDAG